MAQSIVFVAELIPIGLIQNSNPFRAGKLPDIDSVCRIALIHTFDIVV